MPYEPETIEPKWRRHWLENETSRVETHIEKAQVLSART
jgi:hypothetical protein